MISRQGHIAELDARTGLRALFAAALIALAVAFVCAFAFQPAFAVEEEDLEARIAEAEKDVESASEVYAEAVKKLEEIEATIAEHTARVQEIQAKLPVQQERCSQAIRALYKMHNEGFGLLSMILSSESLENFINTISYVNDVQGMYLDDITALKTMEDELNATLAQLETDRAEAEQLAKEAEEAMQAAIAEHQAAQAAAAAKAAEEAEAAAAAIAAAQQNGSQDPNSPTQETITDGQIAHGDGADWSNRDAFISEWTSRINSYLSGTPLAGYGVNFATAAWNYGVDPRWSPAISYMESSCGRYCFRPHNAWGWGNKSWDSWEEAIDAHVNGLSRLYGYTISLDAAYMYCPPNAEYWYTIVSREMNKI